MDIKKFIELCQQRVNTALVDHLRPSKEVAPKLYEAMRYSVCNGGKRVRPILVYATAKALDCLSECCDDTACAVELIHAYSLIHDDLPAMDDDDLRRGQPTCHIAFDEATAILAGDALQALAFEILASNPKISAVNKNLMLQRLATASGASGMVAGQAIDLASTGKQLSLDELKLMHRHKTGALISASVMLGALVCDRVNDSQQQALERYAACVGLAFQIKDDILDVEGDTHTLGKQQGSDLVLNKPTYTSILGLNQAKQQAQALHQKAVDALHIFGPEADMLRQLSTYIIERNK